MSISGTPRRRPAGDALQARAVAHHCELAAVAAGIALVALEPSHHRGGEHLGLREAAAASAHRRGRTRRHRRSGGLPRGGPRAPPPPPAPPDPAAAWAPRLPPP